MISHIGTIVSIIIKVFHSRTVPYEMSSDKSTHEHCHMSTDKSTHEHCHMSTDKSTHEQWHMSTGKPTHEQWHMSTDVVSSLSVLMCKCTDSWALMSFEHWRMSTYTWAVSKWHASTDNTSLLRISYQCSCVVFIMVQWIARHVSVLTMTREHWYYQCSRVFCTMWCWWKWKSPFFSTRKN